MEFFKLILPLMEEEQLDAIVAKLDELRTVLENNKKARDGYKKSEEQKISDEQKVLDEYKQMDSLYKLCVDAGMAIFP